jgi:hypothetical protein
MKSVAKMISKMRTRKGGPTGRVAPKGNGMLNRLNVKMNGFKMWDSPVGGRAQQQPDSIENDRTGTDHREK